MGAEISRRSFTTGTAAIITAAGLGAWEPLIASPALASDILRALAAVKAALRPANAKRTLKGLADAKRTDWHYTPRDRPGATLDDMSEPEKRALWDLLARLLSPRGLEQVKNTIKLERILGELENNLDFRDPGDYALVIFGDPTGKDPVSFRFEGHHLSLSALVQHGKGVSFTPVFFGANPSVVPKKHKHRGFRLLGQEQDQAFSLVQSLQGKARKAAIIDDDSLDDIVAGPGREQSLKTFEGQALSGLSDGQAAGVYKLCELFVGTMTDQIAKDVMARIKSDGRDKLHFAWAGSLVPGKPHYFRVHGPSVLIEYDNTQDDANHVHAIWIDPKKLFGQDIIASHHKNAH